MHKVAQKRKKFEYDIISPSVKKETFLKYLEYELNLLQLFTTRKQKNSESTLSHWIFIA